MSQADAYNLLTNEMQPYCELTFADLCELVGQRSSRHIKGDDARNYLVEVAVGWLDDEHEKILIDGMAALASTGPLHRLDRSFIVSEAGVSAA